ncbi:uncharacterized protein [Oscarella lobularis]|uniref:uncharacterized protein n=1 Tax=Oscarella lobularis TaxID=121494 RepID=UPI003313489A
MWASEEGKAKYFSFGTLIEVPKEDKHLVGRDEDVRKLRKYLEHNHLVLVHGLPGIGKTSLVTKLAHEVCSEYGAVVFINCSSSSVFGNSLTKICRSVDQQKVLKSVSQSELIEYMRYWLTHQEEKTLLIFDGLNDVEQESKDVSTKIEALLLSDISDQVFCLFTSRKEVEKIENLRVHQVYHLEPLNKAEVANMLIERCGASNKDQKEREAAALIATRVGGIPLLVDLTANAIIKRTGVPLSVYWDNMKLKKEVRLLDRTEEGYKKTRQLYRQIITENANTPALKELLLVFALSDYPEPLPVDLFAMGGRNLPDCALKKEYRKEKMKYSVPENETNEDAFTILTMMYTRLLLELQKSHLIYYNYTKRSAWMHSAISEEIQELAKSEWKDCAPEGLGLNILSSLLTTTYEAERTDKSLVYEALVPHTFKFIANMDQQKRLVNPHLLLNVGKLTSLLGRFEEAKDLLEREADTAYADVLMDVSEFQKAYTLLEEIRLENVTDFGTYYGSKGRACFGLKKYTETIQWFNKALKQLKDTNEYKHGLFNAYVQLAEAAKHRPDCAAFRRRLDECYEAMEKSHIKVFGKQHQKVAKSSDIIAKVCNTLAGKGYHAAQFNECKRLALNRAIRNYAIIECDTFPEVKEILKELHEDTLREDYIGEGLENSSGHSLENMTELAMQSDEPLGELGELLKNALDLYKEDDD